MFITMCIIAYNEEKTLAKAVESIYSQDYNHADMELLLVDSASTDKTKEMMLRFAADNESLPEKEAFRAVRVLDNPKRTLPCGWNAALAAYAGDAIIKVDAHAYIPPDFVTKNVRLLESGEYITGGRRPSVIEHPTPWNNTLLLAESSMFGSGIAPYRNNPGKTYVKSMFHAAYRRVVFDRIGGFNEDLARTEDNEIHYRMRKAGFQLAFDPDIVSYQYIRSDLKKMLHQKYANGYWIGLTMGVCPGCLSLYHFVPCAFVLAILASVLLQFIFGIIVKTAVPVWHIVRILSLLMWGMYFILAAGMSAAAVLAHKDKRSIFCFALPVLFLLLHVSYGIGTLRGLIKMPAWVKGIREKNGRDQER